jgi:hypothetical protein
LGQPSATGMQMIYMVEMGFSHPERLAEWHRWYMEHIQVLLTVPGFRASQRFEAVVENPAPYLALHEVASADLFQSDAYRNLGGPSSVGEWRSLQTNWHRNLLDGLDVTPEVPSDAYLLLLRDARDIAVPSGIGVDWLRGVGLDGSVRECGLAVLTEAAPVLDLARSHQRVRLFRPITAKVRADR